jgi:hypothetical protein
MEYNALAAVLFFVLQTSDLRKLMIRNIYMLSLLTRFSCLKRQKILGEKSHFKELKFLLFQIQYLNSAKQKINGISCV